jgi:hypothetical protein
MFRLGTALQVGGVLGVQALQRLFGEGRDRGRHLLQVFRGAAGGDHHFLDRVAAGIRRLRRRQARSRTPGRPRKQGGFPQRFHMPLPIRADYFYSALGDFP